MSAPLNLTVYFDFICPWCLIGTRHLQSALQQLAAARPDLDVAIDWRSHQLLPDIPEHGVDYEVFYVNRLGSPAAVAARREQVRQAARVAGLELAFEKIRRMPNTLRAHQLLDAVAGSGSPEQVAALIDCVFTAYFVEGRDIGDAGVLTALADNAGYAGVPLASEESRQRFAAKLAAPPRHAVSGVPFFVFGDRLGASGALLPEQLLAGMMQAMETTPLP